MSERPAFEAYTPKGPFEAWGYSCDDVPSWSTETTLRIYEGGMTEPVYVTKANHTATSTVDILCGQGKLIRTLSSGAPEVIKLSKGDQVVICPDQAYSFVNTGKDDLLLHDYTRPASRPEDNIKLNSSLIPVPEELETVPQALSASSYCHAETTDGKIRTIILPDRFFDLLGQAAAGKMRQEVQVQHSV